MFTLSFPGKLTPSEESLLKKFALLKKRKKILLELDAKKNQIADKNVNTQQAKETAELLVKSGKIELKGEVIKENIKFRKSKNAISLKRNSGANQQSNETKNQNRKKTQQIKDLDFSADNSVVANFPSNPNFDYSLPTLPAIPIPKRSGDSKDENISIEQADNNEFANLSGAHRKVGNRPIMPNNSLEGNFSKTSTSFRSNNHTNNGNNNGPPKRRFRPANSSHACNPPNNVLYFSSYLSNKRIHSHNDKTSDQNSDLPTKYGRINEELIQKLFLTSNIVSTNVPGAEDSNISIMYGSETLGESHDDDQSPNLPEMKSTLSSTAINPVDVSQNLNIQNNEFTATERNNQQEDQQLNDDNRFKLIKYNFQGGHNRAFLTFESLQIAEAVIKKFHNSIVDNPACADEKIHLVVAYARHNADSFLSNNNQQRGLTGSNSNNRNFGKFNNKISNSINEQEPEFNVADIPIDSMPIPNRTNKKVKMSSLSEPLTLPKETIVAEQIETKSPNISVNSNENNGSAVSETVKKTESDITESNTPSSCVKTSQRQLVQYEEIEALFDE